MLIVQKYGGTSVGTPERIQAVADRIAEGWKAGHRLAVVVSAMGHTTDELIDLAHKVAPHPPHREMDMLLTAGERISMALLSMALDARRVPAVSFTGSQSGIITDGSHRRARIKRILGDRVRSAVSESKVAIVAGFQGVSEGKEITTLGRGGSDTTAVALAAALGADRCEIFTDVDGVFSADPRIVRDARRWRRIPHDLMVELATRGAGVLHPRSVELAKQFSVSVCVKNSFNRNEGTQVVTRGRGPAGRPGGMEEFQVVGVTADRDKMLISVELARPTVFGAVCERAVSSHLVMVAPAFFGTDVQFYSERDSEAEWRKHLDELVREGFLKKYDLRRDLVPLSVVGDRFSQDGTALSQVIETLARQHISVTIGSASALAITVAVPETHVTEGVQALHDALIGPEAGGG